MNIDVFRNFLGARSRKQAAESALEIASAAYRDLERDVLAEFEKANVNQIKLDGHTVHLHRQVWASARDGDQQRLCTALCACGLGELVRPMVNSHTLSAYVLDQESAGEPLRPELQEAIKVSEVYSARVHEKS